MSRKDKKYLRRKRKVRAKILGAKARPRISVFRSINHIYSQIIDDSKGETLVSASDLELKVGASGVVVAGQVGELLAKKAKAKKITKVVFDRGGYKYQGRVRSLAEGARKGGLTF